MCKNKNTYASHMVFKKNLVFHELSLFGDR